MRILFGKIPVFFIAVFAAYVFLPGEVFAYRLPEYSISETEWQRPTEEVFNEYSAEMKNVSQIVPISKLENFARCHNCRLSLEERKAYKEYLELYDPLKFWEYVYNLKKDLLSLNSDKKAGNEADALAKLIIEKIYALSNEYKINSSALINNAMINMGAKKKGFCYHYTDSLLSMLKSKKWRHYEFHWGAAYDGTFLENNALVITAVEMPFESGIVVDPWRSASKPLWNRVRDDRYPWKELHDVVIED